MPRSVEASPAGQGGTVLWNNGTQNFLSPGMGTDVGSPLPMT